MRDINANHNRNPLSFNTVRLIWFRIGCGQKVGWTRPLLSARRRKTDWTARGNPSCVPNLSAGRTAPRNPTSSSSWPTIRYFFSINKNSLTFSFEKLAYPIRSSKHHEELQRKILILLRILNWVRSSTCPRRAPSSRTAALSSPTRSYRHRCAARRGVPCWPVSSSTTTEFSRTTTTVPRVPFLTSKFLLCALRSFKDNLKIFSTS